jgi:hypothetical protein
MVQDNETVRLENSRPPAAITAAGFASIAFDPLEENNACAADFHGQYSASSLYSWARYR